MAFKVDEDVKAVFSILKKVHQPTMLELLKNYTPFQITVAVLLSSRTKDKTTIQIVKKLFNDCPTPQNFVHMPIRVLEQKLFGVGFYKIKARNVKKLSEVILGKFSGRIPATFEELIALPGVGRKTANCILSYVYHKPAIAVDTHVHRISNRLGWIKTSTPEETEEALQKKIPRKFWRRINLLFVDHGQRICLPVNPRCVSCPINIFCAYGRKALKIEEDGKIEK